MSITTKHGDDGQTGLMFGRRVDKTHPRVEACGTIDELNAALGMARAGASKPLTIEWIADLQKDLVTVMGEIATLSEDLVRFEEQGFSRVEASMVEKVEGRIKELETEHQISFKRWAVPGESGSPSAAALDLARTVARRAERQIVQLIQDEEIENREILRFFNRVSGFFAGCWHDLKEEKLEHEFAFSTKHGGF